MPASHPSQATELAFGLTNRGHGFRHGKDVHPFFDIGLEWQRAEKNIRPHINFLLITMNQQRRVHAVRDKNRRKFCFARLSGLAFFILMPIVPAFGQEIIEGGMRFSARNVDIMSFRSGSVSGLAARGSAAVTGGSLNTGSASSDVTSELNPVVPNQYGSTTIVVAGDNAQLTQVLPLQNVPLQGVQQSRSVRVERGTLDENLRILILQNPKLIELVSKANPDDPSKPFTNLQFAEDYSTLESLLNANKTTGVHIISTSTSTQAINQKIKSDPTKDILVWRNDSTVQARPIYTGYATTVDAGSDAENIVKTLSKGAVGTTGNNINFSVVGFAKNPKPDEGKNTTIAAFATNNRTVGSIRIPEQSDGRKPTLSDIASQYGTSVEQLMQVNNLPSPSIDIAGLNLIVPADLLTVDYHVVAVPPAGQVPETPRSVAKRYGINVSWLLDLNGWTDSEQPLSPGSRVQVPGLTKSCEQQPGSSNCRTNPLPPAQSLAAELETADYGAYTTTEVTYNCSGALAAFCSRFLSPRR